MPQFDPQDLSGRFKSSFRQVNIPNTLDTAIAVVNPDGTFISGGGGGGTVTANQGIPAVVGNAWPIKVTDGVNTAIVQNNQGDSIPNASIIGLQTIAAMYGFNGASWDRLRVDASKNLNVNISATSVTQPVSGTVNVGNFPATTTVVQATGTNLHTVVDNFPATQPVSGIVTANQGTGGASAWKVDGSAVTQPISAASLPLPSGAATSANQATEIADLASIVTNTTGLATQTTLAEIATDTDNLATITTNTNRPTTATSFQTSVTTVESALATNTAKSMVLKAAKTNTDNIYLGTTGVTSSTGYLLEPGDAVGMDITNSNIIHAISGSGTQTLTTLVTN